MHRKCVPLCSSLCCHRWAISHLLRRCCSQRCLCHNLWATTLQPHSCLDRCLQWPVSSFHRDLFNLLEVCLYTSSRCIRNDTECLGSWWLCHSWNVGGSRCGFSNSTTGCSCSVASKCSVELGPHRSGCLEFDEKSEFSHFSLKMFSIFRIYSIFHQTICLLVHILSSFFFII